MRAIKSIVSERSFPALSPLALFLYRHRFNFLTSLSAIFFAAQSQAAEEVPTEYNLQFLQGGSSAAQNSAAIQDFLRGDTVPAGEYLVDIFVNKKLSGRQKVIFQKKAKSGKVEACLRIALLEQLGLDLSKLNIDELVRVQESDCPDLGALVPDLRAEYNANRQELSVSIPQAYVSRAVRGYVDPQLWDEGVNAAFVDYNVTGRRSSTESGNSQSYNMRMLNGLNLGAWRLRNESTVSSGSGRKTEFNSNRTYVQRDITLLKGQLTAGTAYTSSQIFDSYRFQGLQLASDENMLPDGMRGYAPVVRGVAEGNATVEIRQNGYLVYNANVPPGPFEITEFAAGGSNGDLEITVIESDGRKTVFTQSFASLPQMVRKGSLRYNIAGGKYDANNDDDESPIMATGGLTYGLTDNLTLFGGLLAAKKYRAENLGITRNTWLGALSTNITQSTSKGPMGVNSGKSLQFNYAKTLTSTDTTFSLAGYRFSTEGYRTLSDHVEDQRLVEGQSPRGRARTRLDLTVRQTLGNRSNGSLYISGNEQRFWNLRGKSQQYQFGYSNNWKDLSYNIDVTHTRSPDFSSDSNNRTQFTLSVSMPLDFSGKSASLFSSISTDKSNYNIQSGISGKLSETGSTYYNAQVSDNNYDGTRGSLGLSSRTSVARLDGSYSQGRSSNSANFGAAGSLVAHGGGINFGQPVGETFALAHIPGAEPGTRFSGYAGVTTGNNGYAVVPSTQPYRVNWLSLNTADLGSDLELENPIQQLVPRRGSVTLAKFETVAGRRVQFRMLDADGNKLAFGAKLTDAAGKQLGVVDPLGYALVMTDHDSGTLYSTVNEEACQGEFKLPEKVKGSGYDEVALTCSRSA